MNDDTSKFAVRAFGLALLLVGLAAAWYLRDLLLLVFAAVLVACLLISGTDALSRLLRLPRSVSLTLVCLAVLVVAAGFFLLLGSQLRVQLVDLWNQLPDLLKPVERVLNIGSAEEWIAERVEVLLSQTSVVSRIAGFSSAVAGVIANALLVVVAGLYLAVQPQLYFNGLMSLFPLPMRTKARSTLVSVGNGLQWWLVGQLVAMAVVALVTYAGLWMIGIESALALAVIAGILEFIPFLGPILAALPAVALGMAEGPSVAVYVALLYVGIQQLEGNLITPLVQQRSVSLPPAVTLFAILAFGIVFGWLGILLATPLAVASMVAVRQLWVMELSAKPRYEAARERASGPGMRP